MKIIIAGTRSFFDLAVVTNAVYSSPWLTKISEVVSGGADGVDSLGERFAENHLIAYTRFPADWSRHGNAAGPIRNGKMAAYADALIAVWNGKSSGTKNMIVQMVERGKPVYVYPAIHEVDKASSA